jgi:hypothetical protein
MIQSSRADGVGLCVELMGCFSPSEVQRAAANVCARVAASSQAACEVLLGADVGSMIEQHVKKPETTLRMFEDASHVVAAIAGHPSLVRRSPRSAERVLLRGCALGFPIARLQFVC